LPRGGRLRAGHAAAVEGRTVTVDGTTGEILEGIVPVRAPEPSENPALAQLVAWAREHQDAVGEDHPLSDLAGEAPVPRGRS
jgi:hypothetical protein